MLANKKTKIDHKGGDRPDGVEPADANGSVVNIESLSIVEISITFGYLSLGEILLARVCMKFKDVKV